MAQDTESDDEYTREDAQTLLMESYGGVIEPTEEELEIADLVDIHDGASSFLAMHDKSLDDELPEDLPPETKRQISTAVTQLQRALRGIEETAAERLNGLDSGKGE